MSLQEFLSGDVKLETGNMTNVEEIVAFVASWCPHSKNACSKFQNYDAKKYVFAVDLNSLVDPNDLTKTITGNNNYSYLYDEYIKKYIKASNKPYKWSFPHIFMKKNISNQKVNGNCWHYVGGEDSMKKLARTVYFGKLNF